MGFGVLVAVKLTCSAQWKPAAKAAQLGIVTLAAISPDFNVGIGIAGLQDIAKAFGVSTEKVTSFTTS